MSTTQRLTKISYQVGEAIDHAAVEPLAWQEVVDLIFQSFPGSKVALYVDDARGQGNRGVVSQGFEKRSLSDYVSYYSRINPWLSFWTRSSCLRALAADEVAPSSLFMETEFYQDWLKPVHEAESAVGIKLAHDESWMAMLASHYGGGTVKRYNRELPFVLSNNALKIRRALELNRIARSAAVKQLASNFLHSFLTPAFALNAQGRILSMNAAAEKELVCGKSFRIGAQQRLLHVDEHVSQRIVATAAQIAANRGPLSGGCDFEISRPASLSVSVFAFVPRLSDQLFIPGNSLGRFALLLFRQPDRLLSLDDWGPFSLTPAERRLANHIAAGTSLRDSANQTGITYQTARNQLKSIFAKTRTHRQSELVALRARMSGKRISSSDG
jgi:DNA-binding CsgD family transcriptional regulator